jgi:hypothetical protein
MSARTLDDSSGVGVTLTLPVELQAVNTIIVTGMKNAQRNLVFAKNIFFDYLQMLLYGCSPTISFPSANRVGE